MIPIIPIAPAPVTKNPLVGQLTSSGLRNPPPLSLYIHIPWCVRKCPYCDFNSHESRNPIPESAYVDALITDLEQATPLVWGRKVRSIFFGGGTPSLFSAESIDRILSHVRMLTPLEYEAEITLEANPGTFEAERFAGYRDAGVNRISIGIQSFNPRHLQALGRIHNTEEAQYAAEHAIRIFGNVNLDLMYALPEQTLEEALQDMRTAIALGPTHISAYHLTLEPNTPFYYKPPTLPDDDTSATMQEAIEQLLADHGYAHYETSAFGKAGKRCRHNLNYWAFGDYLGIGAGAHSKLSFHDRILRQSRIKQPNAYMKAVTETGHIDEERLLDRADLGFEFMMNALRLTEGFDPMLFTTMTGQALSTVEPALQQAVQRGLITRTPELIAPTALGQRFLNELLQLFLEA
jgi:oxygen-independent coproporphyrinogen-3 oxidase